LKKGTLLFILVLTILSCSKKILKPKFIIFNVKKDSTYVYAHYYIKSPFQLVIKKKKSNTKKAYILNPLDTLKILQFDSKKIDTLTILNNFNFTTAYGNYKITNYDTLYNYQFPFKKNKKYKILQGYNGDFSHNNNYSRYAIDFKMPVGDTILAPRNGWIVGITQKHDKQGITQEFRKYGNYITMYHEDGTFSQYVHLKKNGALVKLNDFFKKGKAIAISGFTGLTTEPHLHFAVFKPVENNLESIPIVLNNKKGETYVRDSIAYY